MLFIITENKDILNKTLSFVDELSIVYSRTVKELTDYRIVQSEDVVLLANGETVSSNIRKKFPEQTTLIDLGKNGGVENLDIAYLFIKVLGRPRLGAYLHDQSNLLNSNLKKDRISSVNSGSVEVEKRENVTNSNKTKLTAKKEPIKDVIKKVKKAIDDIPAKKKPEIRVETIEEEVPIRPKRKHLVDDELEGVQEQLLSEGIPGKAVRNVEVTYTDGVETGRKVLRETFTVVEQPVPARYIVSPEKDRMTPPNQKYIERDQTRTKSAPKTDKKDQVKQGGVIKATNKLGTNRLGAPVEKTDKNNEIFGETPNFVDENKHKSLQEEEIPIFEDVTTKETQVLRDDETPTFVDVMPESKNNEQTSDDFPTFEDSLPSMFRNN